MGNGLKDLNKAFARLQADFRRQGEEIKKSALDALQSGASVTLHSPGFPDANFVPDLPEDCEDHDPSATDRGECRVDKPEMRTLHDAIIQAGDIHAAETALSSALKDLKK